MRPVFQMVSDCLRQSMSATWHLGSEDKNFFRIYFLLQIVEKRYVESKSWWSCKIDGSYPRLCLMHRGGNIQDEHWTWVFGKYKSDNETFIRDGLWLSTTSRLGWRLVLNLHSANCEQNEDRGVWVYAGNLYGLARLIASPTQDCV